MLRQIFARLFCKSILTQQYLCRSCPTASWTVSLSPAKQPQSESQPESRLVHLSKAAMSLSRSRVSLTQRQTFLIYGIPPKQSFFFVFYQKRALDQLVRICVFASLACIQSALLTKLYLSLLSFGSGLFIIHIIWFVLGVFQPHANWVNGPNAEREREVGRE